MNNFLLTVYGSFIKIRSVELDIKKEVVVVRFSLIKLSEFYLPKQSPIVPEMSITEHVQLTLERGVLHTARLT